jgi:hypothetical protein
MKILGFNISKHSGSSTPSNLEGDGGRLNLAATSQPSNSQGSKKRLSPTAKRTPVYHTELALNTFRQSVESARSIDNPNRIDLYRVYGQISKDSHLASQVRTAIQSVLQSGFFLSKTDTPDKNATMLLQTAWFDAFVEHCLQAEFWGHSLIEFSQLNDEGMFTDAKLMPRENVKQEFGLFLVDPANVKGIDYRTAASKFGLIEIGDKYDLGIYELAAIEVITKNYARTDWSQASEKFGMPLLKILTSTQDPDELDRMENMAANFGSNGYVILSKDDDAEIVHANSGDWFNIYKANIDGCDQNISKLINGQTGTSDEKAFVGSAEVHERILNDYTRARLRTIKHIADNQLIPFLVEWGYPLDGFKFYYTDLLEKAEEDPNEENPNSRNNGSSVPPIGGNEGGTQKKKLTLNFPDWVLNMPEES